MCAYMAKPRDGEKYKSTKNTKALMANWPIARIIEMLIDGFILLE